MSADAVVLSFGDTVLRESDIELLQGPNWLNDSLIGFYFEYLQTVAFKDHPEVLFISPEVTQILKVSAKQELHIFLEPLEAKSKQLVVLALNDCERTDQPGGSHWSVLVYSRPEQKMFHLDSAGSNRHQARKLVCNIAFALSDDGFDYEDLLCLNQQNSYDCGIFVLCHAEMIVRHFLKGKMVQTVGMLQTKMVDEKRNELLRLIHSLAQQR